MSESGPAVLLLEQSESQALGVHVTIPGPDVEGKATFAKALLKLAGFTIDRKLIRSKGTRSYRYEVITLEVSPLL